MFHYCGILLKHQYHAFGLAIVLIHVLGLMIDYLDFVMNDQKLARMFPVVFLGILIFQPRISRKPPSYSSQALF
jgi:hypothetical protein